MTGTAKRTLLIALTTLAVAGAAIGDAASASGQGANGAGGAGGAGDSGGDNGRPRIVLGDVAPAAARARIPGGPDNYPRVARPRIEGCRIDPGHDFDRGRMASQFCVR